MIASSPFQFDAIFLGRNWWGYPIIGSWIQLSLPFIYAWNKMLSHGQTCNVIAWSHGDNLVQVMYVRRGKRLREAFWIINWGYIWSKTLKGFGSGNIPTTHSNSNNPLTIHINDRSALHPSLLMSLIISYFS